MKKDLIVMVIDDSGSMTGKVDAVIEGYNSFIEDQKDVDREADVSLTFFNTSVHSVFVKKPISEVGKLEKEDYRPSGRTALLDAMGRTINKTNSSGLFDTPITDDEYDKVIFAIFTDGRENSSVEYSKDDIKDLIHTTQYKYDWEYFFLAADMEQINEAKDYGICHNNLTNYDNTSEGTRVVYKGLSNQVLESRVDNS